MDIILARFWGIILIVSSLAYFLNKGLYKQSVKLVENEDVMLVSGLLALILGAIHIAVFNVWEVSFRGIITLFGWISLAKGAARMSLPDSSKSWIKNFTKKTSFLNVLLVGFLALGIYFLYIGYFS